MSRLHSLFEGHCFIFRGVELGGTLGTCTYQYLATTNQAVPCNNFDQIIKYIYMFFLFQTHLKRHIIDIA